jgi:hypothetical protein
MKIESKIEKQMCEAIAKRKSWSSSNTRVEYDSGFRQCSPFKPEHADVYIHGNHIATFTYADNSFTFNSETLRKCPTRTTKSRLRALGAY